jgi:hypothetical protein
MVAWKRDLEQRLRDGGFSRRQARRMVAEAFCRRLR